MPNSISLSLAVSTSMLATPPRQVNMLATAPGQAGKRQPGGGNELSGRYKLWEISDRIHCSIIGTYLEVKELKQIARKAEINLTDPLMTDYQIHQTFVGLADRKVLPFSFTLIFLNSHCLSAFTQGLQEVTALAS